MCVVTFFALLDTKRSPGNDPRTVADFNHTPRDSILWPEFFSHDQELIYSDQTVFIRISAVE